MATYQRASGIAIEVADDVTIEDAIGPGEKRRGTRRALPKAVALPGTTRAAPEENPVISAMLAQDLVRRIGTGAETPENGLVFSDGRFRSPVLQ